MHTLTSKRVVKFSRDFGFSDLLRSSNDASLGYKPKHDLVGKGVQRMTDTDYVQIVTATETREAGVELGKSATKMKLAASAQVYGPILSTTWHLGEVVEAEEWKLTLKTTTDRADDLISYVAANHPWQNPEITVTPFAAGTDAYREWLDRVTK